MAVKKILQKASRLSVVLTRGKDQALSFDERAAVSNAARASLFVSIHGAAGANAQVYMQDLSDDSPARATRLTGGDFLGFETGSEQQEMLWGRQQRAHLKESGELGRRLARHLTGQERAEPAQ